MDLIFYFNFTIKRTIRKSYFITKNFIGLFIYGFITCLVPNLYTICRFGPWPLKCVNLVPNILVLYQNDPYC